MSTDISIRDYLIGDEDQIIPLLIKAFPFWSKLDDPAAYFKWKYLDTPRGSYIAVATIGEKIVGCDLCIRLSFKFGDIIASGELSGDTTTDADYRGRGIYRKITDFENINHYNQFSYWGTSNPYILAAQKKESDTFRFPDKMIFMVKINDIAYHLKNRPVKRSTLVKYAYSGLKLLNNFVSLFQQRKLQTDYTITQIEKFDDSNDKFWDIIKKDYDFSLEKNSKYLNWRYSDARGGKYVIFEAKQDHTTLGYIVINVFSLDNYAEGYISELLTLNNRRDVADTLIKTSLEYLDREKINVTYYMATSKSPYLNNLEINGFLNAIIKSHNIYLNKKDERLHNILFSADSSRIYMSYGDFL